jgi:hypothetical protein
MEIRQDDRDVKTAYANACSAVLSPEEIALRFGMRQGEDRVVLSHNIVVSPATARRLASILNEALAQYTFRGPPPGAQAGARAEVPPQAVRRQPILPLMEAISEQARLPLRLVKELGAGFVISGSFKMHHGSVLANRYLVTLAKQRLGDAADERIVQSCRAMAMPEDMIAPFAQRLAPANYVHFGFEEAADSCIYKVYMEYWTNWQEELRVNKRSDAFVGGYGYKWDPARGSGSALTRYTCHPLLEPQAMLQRAADACGGAAKQPVQVLRGLLDAAVPRIPVDKMLYLEADEEGNSRRSFDVNLLQAKLLLADLYPLWSAMCGHYGVDAETFNAHFTPIRNEPFAHIQAGVDRTGRDFTTIYYGTEAH